MRWGLYWTATPVDFEYQMKQKRYKIKLKEDLIMKGYNTNDGFMGYVNGSYILFASESDYREWLED